VSANREHEEAKPATSKLFISEQNRPTLVATVSKPPIFNMQLTPPTTGFYRTRPKHTGGCRSRIV